MYHQNLNFLKKMPPDSKNWPYTTPLKFFAYDLLDFKGLGGFGKLDKFGGFRNLRGLRGLISSMDFTNLTNSISLNKLRN